MDPRDIDNRPAHMPPGYTASDLDAVMSRLGMGGQWSQSPPNDTYWHSAPLANPSLDHSPPPSLTPFTPTPYPSAFAPPAPTAYTSIQSPPEPTSRLTERDISRRSLAASGLDVSAPEFVPSFAKTHRAIDPTAEEFVPYNYAPDTTYEDPFQHSFHNEYHYVEEDGDYQSPELDQQLYANAVQQFEEEFPALGATKTAESTPQRDDTSQTSPIAQCSTDDPAQLESLFPKALGWGALQREEARKQQLSREKMQQQLYQAELDEYAATLEDAFDDVPEPRLTNDIGDLWVSTGESVRDLYKALRAEAAEEASIRNKFFDRAAAAFKRNDGASAKRLGAQGREANERMKELHRRAADAIFEARNPAHATDIIDLHGLHVSEAVERLPIALEKAPVGTVRILTGSGHHTKGTGRARLRPVVKKWLQENEYFFEEVADANEYVGSFKVEKSR